MWGERASSEQEHALCDCEIGETQLLILETSPHPPLLPVTGNDCALSANAHTGRSNAGTTSQATSNADRLRHGNSFHGHTSELPRGTAMVRTIPCRSSPAVLFHSMDPISIYDFCMVGLSTWTRHIAITVITIWGYLLRTATGRRPSRTSNTRQVHHILALFVREDYTRTRTRIRDKLGLRYCLPFHPGQARRRRGLQFTGINVGANDTRPPW